MMAPALIEDISPYSFFNRRKHRDLVFCTNLLYGMKGVLYLERNQQAVHKHLSLRKKVVYFEHLTGSKTRTNCYSLLLSIGSIDVF